METVCAGYPRVYPYINVDYREILNSVLTKLRISAGLIN